MKTKQDYIRDRDIDALNHVLSTELGRWFFCRLLDNTDILKRSFTGNSETFFNEGKRSVGLKYMQMLGAIGDGVEGVLKYHQAQLEYINQQKLFKNLEEIRVVLDEIIANLYFFVQSVQTTEELFIENIEKLKNVFKSIKNLGGKDE